MRLVSYRVICTVSSSDIILFFVTVAHRKNITGNFLQNEANITALIEMHDKASYQVLKSDEVVVKFSLRINLALIYIAKK